MPQVTIPELLPRFSGFLAQQMGLQFPAERWPDLMRGMTAALSEFKFEDMDKCMLWLMSKPMSKSQIEILAGHLTIGETYFFREPQVFEALQTHILPALIESRRQTGMRLRIWSAACSTGEEAYSIAILIQQLIPDYKRWSITILGTDINPHALRKAESGIYSDWSFRNSQPWLREKYFHPLSGKRYRIVPEVREMVTFSYLNLAEDAYPSLANNTHAMDIIFCRNVLMYFEPGLAKKVIQQHYQSLLDGSWLIVSPAEISPPLFAQLETVNFPGAALHRKPAQFAWDTAAKPLDAPVKIDLANISIPRPTQQKPADMTAFKKQSMPVTSTYSQALALYRQGRYAEAIELIDRLIAEQSDNAQAMNLMVRIFANQGQLVTALNWCVRAIAADRFNPVGYYLKAAVLQEQGHIEEAMLSLKRTLYLDQDFVLAHFTLGNLYHSQSRHKESRKYFANTISLLKVHSPEDVLPESEGMTTGRLIEIVRSITAQDA